MFKRKHILVLLLLIVGICAMSSVSAEDNVTDVVAVDVAPADDVATALDEEVGDVAPADDVATALDEEVGDVASDDGVATALIKEASKDVENQEVLASADEDVIALDESGDILSGYTAPSDRYTIDLKNNYLISSKNGGKIVFSIDPYIAYGYNDYNFFFAIFEGYNKDTLKIIYKSGVFADDADDDGGNYEYTINGGQLLPGTYRLVAANDGDNKIMDIAYLRVAGTEVISASNYAAYYNSGKKMTVKVTDKATKKPLKYVKIKAVFSNGKKTITKNYVTNAKGKFAFVPPVGVGKWSVTFSSGVKHIKAKAVKKSITVYKSKVAIKAYKVKGYSGGKVTLAAAVKSHGKKVNSGIVTFRFNGKNYKAKVKNGVAKKAVKLGKPKTYKYAAIFKGKNFQTKKAVSVAVAIKVYATKVIAPAFKLYRDVIRKPFVVMVKTKSGQPVKNGKVAIIDRDGDVVNSAKVKNGVAKLIGGSQNWCYIGSQGFMTHFFKKAVTQAYKVVYVPSSKLYKPSVGILKVTELYRCISCGSTSSHMHSDGARYIVS